MFIVIFTYIIVYTPTTALAVPSLTLQVGEQLDPSLEPVLLKQTFMQGGRLLIRLGDSDIDYDKNFRFYMTTKLSNPHYLPEVCIKVTVINFTVTKSGLEDQLLSDVVRLERPDLETQRNQLVVQINKAKNELRVSCCFVCLLFFVCLFNSMYYCLSLCEGGREEGS